MNIKKLSAAFGFLAVVFLVFIVLRVSGFFPYCDTTLYDTLLKYTIDNSPRAMNPQIVPVDLNDKSEMNLGSRIDDRSAFGDLFSVISHSDAYVALDFIFRGEREEDQYMLDAISRVPHTIIAVVPVPEGRENISYRELTPDEKTLLRKHLWRPREFGSGHIPRAGTFVMPFIELGEQASQLAHISIDPDSDGVYRRTPLFYAWEDGFIPSISLAAAVADLGVSGDDLEIHYGKELIIPLGPDEKISIPIDSTGSVVVPFGGKWEDTTHRYSFDTLVNASRDQNVLNDVRNDLTQSLCFVADTTFEKKDVGPVPFEKVYPLSGIHTWVASAIFDASVGENSFFRETPAMYRVVCLILFSLVFLGLGIYGKDRIFHSVFAFCFLAFSGITLYLWFFRRIMPWYGAGAFVILLSWFLGFIYRFIGQRRRQTVLERYVPRPVAQKLISNQRTNLTPVYKELTVMFSDIQSFTSWSADKEARDVHNFLNNYLETMADVLFSHNATVDKFMGDGILAFFGDPLDLPNNAGAAIYAAIDMQNKIQTLREIWKPKAGIDLKVRIGINSGKVIVGDLGTSRRIEYTVIGSAVNLAQRMEGLAPAGGILVTEFTKAAFESKMSLPGGTGAGKSGGADKTGNVGSHFSFGEKQELAVKGYDKPVPAYQIVF